MTPSQCRAARALLDWTQDKLAYESGVSLSSLRNFERGKTMLVRQNLMAVVRALESAGIEFIPGGARLLDR